MAQDSQGTVVTWGSYTLSEIVAVSVDGIQADTVEVTPKTQVGRSKRYSTADIDGGTITVTCRGTTAMNASFTGLTGSLSIVAPSVSMSFSKAILETFGWTASVGALQEYRVAFKVEA